MPYHRVWVGRVLLISLVFSALESRHGTFASSIYRPYQQEYAARDAINNEENIDTLLEEFRRIEGKHHEEIAKEKPVLAPYGGGRQGRQGYRYGDISNYDEDESQPRRYYPAVRGQKTKMPAWDRGEEGLVEQYDPSKGRGGHLGNRLHHPQNARPQEEAKEHIEPQEVAAPVQHEDSNEEEEQVEKESNQKTDIEIQPIAHDPEEHDHPTHLKPAARQQFDDNRLHPVQEVASMADIYFLAVVAGCSVAGLVGLVVAGVCWYRLQKNVKAASEVEYPAYGITGPTKEALGSPGDRKLAQSAQMYHYQHQKQQMIALEKANGEMKDNGSEDDSDEENEEGDYTVYECPGLAPTGEMEVKNPLFSEETPVTPTPDDRREMK